MKCADPLVVSLHCVADVKWVTSGVERLSTLKWAVSMLCGYLHEGCGGGSLHRSHWQVQTSGTAWPKCSGALGVWLHGVGPARSASCREQVILYLPLWQRANNDFSWSLLFSKSRFRLLCFSLSAAFHRQAFCWVLCFFLFCQPFCCFSAGAAVLLD